MAENTLDDLINYSHNIGKDLSLVQGPGGNTSVKVDNKVWVKASGKWLANAQSEKIFCLVAPDNPKKDIIEDSGLKPSIETHFHTMLPMNAIFHVHSIGSLTWAFRKCGKEYLAEKLPKLLWVGYQKPGKELAELITTMPYLDADGAILQNHGMIVWANSLKECYERLLSYEKNLLRLAFDVSTKNECRSIQLEALENSPYLTPDHAVFMNSKNKAVNVWQIEALTAIKRAMELIPKTCEIDYLNEESVEALINWDEEVYRKRQNE